MTPGAPVPDALASAEITDANGHPGRLGDTWAGRPCLLVFLRHFGCSACSEHVTELAPRVPSLARLGMAVVFVGNGAPQFVAGFVARTGLERLPVTVVTDESRSAYEAAGLVRGTWSVVGPAALFRKVRGLAKGHVQERVEGDLWQQGGAVVIDRAGRVVYVWRDRSLGDHAPMGDVIDAAFTAALQGAAIA